MVSLTFSSKHGIVYKQSILEKVLIRGRKALGNVQRQKEKTGLKVRYVSDRTDSRSFLCIFRKSSGVYKLRKLCYTMGENEISRRQYEFNYHRTRFKRIYGEDVV